MVEDGLKHLSEALGGGGGEERGKIGRGKMGTLRLGKGYATESLQNTHLCYI